MTAEREGGKEQGRLATWATVGLVVVVWLLLRWLSSPPV